MQNLSRSPLRGAAYELPEEGVSIATRFITHLRNIGYVFDLNASPTVSDRRTAAGIDPEGIFIKPPGIAVAGNSLHNY